MNSAMNKYTFWNFINSHKIEIPIIQRDYAQGRLDKSDLRKSFLTSIKNALSEPNRTLKLDFVYGSEFGESIKPLDGQQRLTTLWLLHWYIALVSGKLNKENGAILRKFSYETRISTRDFCKSLCDSDNFINYVHGESVVTYISKQTWFFSSWRHDPTIQSMLTMLEGGGSASNDGIETMFNLEECTIYWDILTSDNCPIVFYYLPLRDFGLTDDLYIKMNARGKQLTPFENFKADFIDELKNKELFGYLDATTGIPIKIDTTWTDIFWKNKSQNKIDDIFFVFIKRFFANELIKNNTKHVDENDLTYKYLVKETKDYTPGSFSHFRDLVSEDSLKRMVSAIDGLASIYKNSNSNKIFQCPWDSEFLFVPQYSDNNSVSVIYQPQRVVFYAICKYLSEGVFDTVSFGRWMRFVWNIVSDRAIDGRATIRSVRAMRTAMKLIDRIKDSHDVYRCLRQLNNIEHDDEGENQEEENALTRQFHEEIIKASQIIDNDGNLTQYEGDENGLSTWEEVIKYAESLAFFNGSIRFMLRNGNGDTDWEDFGKKLNNAKNYFCESGVVDLYKVPITRALVYQCTDWDYQIYDKQIFNTNWATWNWILLAERYMEPVHSILSADSLESVPIREFDRNEYNTFVSKKTLPFGEMVKGTPTGRFRWHLERLGYYKPYGQDAITFDWTGFNRNNTLTELLDRGVIQTGQRIAGTNFYRGWHIDFVYRGRAFQWYSNNNIYLIVDGNYCIKDGNSKEELEKYYCFEVSNRDAKSIVEQLNNLCEEFQKTEEK